MKTDPSPQVIQEVKRAARAAAAQAYAPYSKFRVGAAVLCEGTVYSGVNVENASYGLAICAERNAVFSAITHGARHIDAICVYAATGAPVTPCGACLQVLSEFASDALVLCCTDDDAVERRYTLRDLLPAAFQLKK